MPMLSRVHRRFEIELAVEGSDLKFRGVVNEPPTGEPPAQRFNIPRRLLLVGVPSPAEIGQIVHTPSGQVFLLGDHGLSESRDLTLFREFRLFAVTDRLSWKRRTLVTHPVSGVTVDDTLADMGLAAGALEPNRETFDRGFSATWSNYHFVTAADVEVDDLIDDKKVTRADKVLGLTLCELQ